MSKQFGTRILIPNQFAAGVSAGVSKSEAVWQPSFWLPKRFGAGVETKPVLWFSAVVLKSKHFVTKDLTPQNQGPWRVPSWKIGKGDGFEKSQTIKPCGHIQAHSISAKSGSGRLRSSKRAKVMVLRNSKQLNPVLELNSKKWKH